MTDDQPKRLTWKESVTPNIWNRLVESGIDYAMGFAAVPLCTPTRASIFSGKYQHNHDVTQNTTSGYSQTKANGALADGPAVRLDNLGYRVGYFGKFQNGYQTQAASEIPPGYDQSAWFVHHTAVGVEGDPEPSHQFNRFGTLVTYSSPPEYTSDLIADEVESFLGSHNPATPFFITASILGPHRPYIAAPTYSDDYDGWVFEEVPSMSGMSAGERTTQRGYQEGKLEEMREADAAIERIFASLAANGYTVGPGGNTYVIFTSDNGYLHGEHDLYTKDYPWEEAVVIPFAAVGPTVAQGVTSQAIVSHVDIPCTICDLAGAAWTDYDGRSLVPTFDGSTPSGWREHVLVESETGNFAEIRMHDYSWWRPLSGGTGNLYDMTAADVMSTPDAADTYQQTNITSTAEGVAFRATYNPILTSLRSCSGQGCRDLETA